ncbi:MAG: hypothetical protein WBF13_06775 [Candidatus Zixiibacteriota bacterium]
MKLKEQRSERIEKMYFTFDHSHRVPEEIGRYTSKLVLLALGVVVILLVILLSFENADGANLTFSLSFDAPSGSAKANAADNGPEIDLEQTFWRSELKNSPPEGWGSQSQ